MSKYLDDSGLGYFWSQLKTKLADKQDTLVSGTNIKTVNNESLLGSGNISISGGTPEILIVTATQTLANITADTTYADIYAAMTAGKEVIVKYTQATLTAYIYFYADACPLYTGETIYFWQVEATSGRVQYLSVTNTDYWQFNNLALAPKASPTFTGTPKAPTASAGTNTTQIATTAFVQGEKKNLIADYAQAANLTEVKTQLTTWWNAMEAATVGFYMLETTAAFLPFTSSSVYLVRLRKLTTIGVANLFRAIGSSSTVSNRYEGISELEMVYRSGAWGDPVQPRAILGNYYDYSNRPTDANTAIPYSDYDGSLYTFKVTSSMASHYPVTNNGSTRSEGHILHAAWEGTGDYATQLFLPVATAAGSSVNGTRHVQVRGSAGSNGWQSWEKLAWIDDIGERTLKRYFAGSSSSSNVYCVFCKIKKNSGTSNQSAIELLLSGNSNITQTNQGLNHLCIVNRSGSFSYKLTVMDGGAGTTTFGYYDGGDDYWYVGVKNSGSYALWPSVLIFKPDTLQAITYGIELGNYYSSTTAPTGWTAMTATNTLATTADINTAIGAALLASY